MIGKILFLATLLTIASADIDCSCDSVLNAYIAVNDLNTNNFQISSIDLGSKYIPTWIASACYQLVESFAQLPEAPVANRKLRGQATSLSAPSFLEVSATTGDEEQSIVDALNTDTFCINTYGRGTLYDAGFVQQAAPYCQYTLIAYFTGDNFPQIVGTSYDNGDAKDTYISNALAFYNYLYHDFLQC
mmetsp:Transcript_78566/g.91866  ORF Transcript_78566/g.91866 Transcript_78566/m.91866 type:complete len:188 (+) Transcript_78566:43-606(+)